MGDFHCWTFFRRIACVTLLLAGCVDLCRVEPASAAEEYTEQVAKTIATTDAVDTLRISKTDSPSVNSEPLRLHTELQKQASKPSIVPQAGDKSGDKGVSQAQSAEPLVYANAEIQENSANPVLYPEGSEVDLAKLEPQVGETEEEAKESDAEPSGASPFLTFKNNSSDLDLENTNIDEILTRLGGEARADAGLSNEETELVIQIWRKNRVLSSSSLAIQKQGKIYVPVVSILRSLNINIEPDIPNQKFQGFFSRENNKYAFNAAEGTYTYQGKTTSFPVENVIIQDHGQAVGDFYIAIETLNEFLPLDLEFNYSNLSLFVKTPLKLPKDLSQERSLRQEALLSDADAKAKGLNLIPVKNNYQWFTPPALNISNQLRWREKGDNQPINTTSVSGQNDLLGFRTNYNVSGSIQPDDTFEFRNARLNFVRQDLGAGYLPGPLSRVEGGDVSLRPSPLVDSSVRGRGAYISSSPDRRQSTFDEIIIEGTAQPGWEVELYSGNRLLDFGVVDERGEYRFEDVPLDFGSNQIKIVLYGPQGQIEERIEPYPVRARMLPPGKTGFDLGIVEANQNLIRLDDSLDSQPQGTAYQARVDHGISHWISGFATFTDMPTEDGKRKYASVGANLSAFGGSALVEAYKEIGAGEALDMRYTRNFSGLRVNLSNALYKDFQSEDTGYDANAKKRETQVKLSTNLPSFAGTIGLALDYIDTLFEDDSRNTDVRGTVSGSYRGTRVTNKISTSLRDQEHRQTTGDLNVNTRLSPFWQLRTRLNYDVYPERDLDDASIEIRYRNGRRFTSAVEYTRDIQRAENRISANASYDFGSMLAGIDMGWGEQAGYTFGVRANTSLGPYGQDGRYIASSENMIGRATILGRLYEDVDADGQFSEGDRPIEKGRFQVGRQYSKPSNKDGYAVVERAGPQGYNAITVDQDSLPNDFMASSLDGYSTYVRPTTHVPFVDFPVIMTGTIDGNIYFEDGQPAPGMIIQLVDDQGRVVQEASTAFDGFYTFEYVKPGTYTVRVSDSHQVSVPAVTVTVTSEELFAYGIDLHFQEQAGDVSAAEKADGDSGRVAQLNHAPAAEGTVMPAPTSSDGGFQAAVRSVRIGEHPYRVRLVLDLSAPSDYFISSWNNGKVITIDLPSTAWDAIRNQNFENHPLFQKVKVLALGDANGNVTGTRLIMEGRDAVKIFYNASLPAENGMPNRAYIDFMKVAK